jgi:hypothetical protein
MSSTRSTATPSQGRERNLANVCRRSSLSALVGEGAATEPGCCRSTSWSGSSPPRRRRSRSRGRSCTSAARNRGRAASDRSLHSPRTGPHSSTGLACIRARRPTAPRRSATRSGTRSRWNMAWARIRGRPPPWPSCCTPDQRHTRTRRYKASRCNHARRPYFLKERPRPAPAAVRRATDEVTSLMHVDEVMLRQRMRVQSAPARVRDPSRGQQNIIARVRDASRCQRSVIAGVRSDFAGVRSVIATRQIVIARVGSVFARRRADFARLRDDSPTRRRRFVAEGSPFLCRGSASLNGRTPSVMTTDDLHACEGPLDPRDGASEVCEVRLDACEVGLDGCDGASDACEVSHARPPTRSEPQHEPNEVAHTRSPSHRPAQIEFVASSARPPVGPVAEKVAATPVPKARSPTSLRARMAEPFGGDWPLSRRLERRASAAFGRIVP